MENYQTLYAALSIFRDATLAFIIDRLKGAYGDEAWKDGVQRVFSSKGISVKPEYQILDFSYFPNVFEGNWNQVFSEPFHHDRTVLVWLREIADSRNAVAHPKTGDLDDNDTWRILDTMERFLKIFNVSAANDITKIKGDLRKSWVESGSKALGLEQGELGINYDQGLTKLNQVLLERFGERSKIFLDFLAYRRRLFEVFSQENRGITDRETVLRKERILRELNKLALEHLGVSFEEACVIIKPSLETHLSEDSNRQVEIGSKLANKEYKRILKVFLCHSSGDKPAVRKLYRQLQLPNIDPWLDEEKLLPGVKWRDEIPKAVRSSDVVLVCLSSTSVNKAGYLQKEIRIALDVADEQPEGAIFLIPLKLEECDVPEQLRDWHWVNLFEEKGFDRLMRALRRRAETLGIGVD